MPEQIVEETRAGMAQTTIFLKLARFVQHLLANAKRSAVMNNKELIQKIAYLESINDQLQAELQYIDEIAKKIGFQEGLKTLKEAAQELLEEQEAESGFEEEPPAVG